MINQEQKSLAKIENYSPPNESSNFINRIIVEVTNRCNLDCSMCVRKSWNYELGSISRRIYMKLLHDIQGTSHLPEIFFGGYGEPLSHPDIITMIRKAKEIGARTGLVTNGTLLSPGMSRALIRSGLDRLWISLDGMHHGSFQNEDHWPQLIHNLEIFQDLKNNPHLKRDNLEDPEVGFVFVLTKSNSSNLTELVDLGIHMGVKSFFITNLEAYSEEMAGKIPYQAVQRWDPASRNTDQSDLADLVNKLKSKAAEINIEGSLTNPSSRCPFAEKGDIAVRWDGYVSPCLPLLYSHTSIVGSWKHQVYSYTLGNITSRSLQDIWLDQKYTNLREKLLEEVFSPCVNCRDCWLSEDNRLDCMGFEHPTCGGCLWAHGVIGCP